MRNLRNKIKTKKGITLVALIITIIVLLILAGVVINMTLGNDGIINKAQGAVNMYKNATEKEEYALANLDNLYQVGNTRNVDASLKTDILNMVYPVGSIYI